MTHEKRIQMADPHTHRGSDCCRGRGGIFFVAAADRCALCIGDCYGNPAEDGQGVLPQSGFAVSSRYSIKEADLRAMLDVEPDLEYTLSGSGKNWTLTPSAPLLDNTVYTIQVKNPARRRGAVVCVPDTQRPFGGGDLPSR